MATFERGTLPLVSRVSERANSNSKQALIVFQTQGVPYLCRHLVDSPGPHV